MRHSCFAGIVDEGIRHAAEPAHAADGEDLGRGQVGGAVLISCVEEFQECHGCGEGAGHVGVEDACPKVVGAVVEIIVPDLRDGAFACGFGTGVGGGIEGCLAGVVDQNVNVSGFGCDLVDRSLGVFVGIGGAADGD